MDMICRPSRLSGSVDIPGSKSHTIRGVLIASLADGESVLERPLVSTDTDAAVAVYSALGAEFHMDEDRWRIRGCGSALRHPEGPLDVGNSGTTLRTALGSCTLLPETNGAVLLTGDAQIQKRPCGPLVDALNALGARISSTNGNDSAPFEVRGKLKGGACRIEAASSQYLTSLLLSCPLAEDDTDIDVPLLNERPYVQITLDWLALQGIAVEHEDMRTFHIRGGQRFQPFTRRIPADFSSATFFLAAGALGANDITCRGLDMGDSQSDRKVVGFLQAMGADVTVAGADITVRPSQLKGMEFDLNDCPDSLPMMAVLGCFAEGTTKLVNVPQARIKETDRIAVMRRELSALGARVEEMADGLIIHQSELHGGTVNGHGDHRVVMALAVCGCAIAGTTRVLGSEAAAVTYPAFAQDLIGLGADIEQSDGGP